MKISEIYGINGANPNIQKELNVNQKNCINETLFKTMELDDSEDYIFDFEYIHEYFSDEANKDVLEEAGDLIPAYYEILTRELKLYSQNDYGLIVIFLNRQIKNENKLKDFLVNMSKLPISVLVIGIKDNEKNQNYSFMNNLSK
jgi:hypothetical protein